MSDRKELAKKLYNDFSGEELGDSEFNIEIPDDLVVFPVGRLDGIMYTTVRDGKTEKYLHQFKGKSAPLLVSTHDGDQLFIVGGNYEFTETGINDR